jgi:hypothetical protein
VSKKSGGDVINVIKYNLTKIVIILILYKVVMSVDYYTRCNLIFAPAFSFTLCVHMHVYFHQYNYI